MDKMKSSFAFTKIKTKISFGLCHEYRLDVLALHYTPELQLNLAQFKNKKQIRCVKIFQRFRQKYTKPNFKKLVKICYDIDD